MIGFIALFLALCSLLNGLPMEGEVFEPKKVGYLHLGKDHGIDPSTVLYVKFSLDHFKKEEVEAVILDLDTPGGEVFSALKIAEMLKKLDIDHKIPVYAYVNNWAISAGAMLAYACRTIGATNGASMGAAEPVMMEGGKMESASEKINSALRSEFSNLANFWGRDPLIAEAMVDKDLILVMREGKIVKLDQESQIKETDRIISAKGKLLTLNAAQLKEYKVADFEAASIKDYPVFHKAEFISYHNWKIDFFTFLAHPAVASFLVMGLLLGIYIEAQHPGLVFPAVGAALCLALILMSKFSMETIHWLELIILLSGLGLLILELFVLPTFGFGGAVGVLLTIVGLVTLMLPHFDKVEFFPNWNLAAMAIVDQLAWISGALILGAACIALMMRRMVRKFALVGEQEIELLPLPDQGMSGKAFTDLRPSGKIEIDGKIYEAITEGRFVEKGKEVSVLRQEGNKLWVR
jgi:membrane-bound ClpP family serine protease